GRIDRWTVAQVESRCGRPPAADTNSRGGGLGRRVVAIGAEHSRTLACQRLGSGASDAAACSRNQRHFACDPPHAALLCCRYRVLPRAADAGATTEVLVTRTVSLARLNSRYRNC